MSLNPRAPHCHPGQTVFVCELHRLRAFVAIRGQTSIASSQHNILNANPRKQLEGPALPHPRSAACGAICHSSKYPIELCNPASIPVGRTLSRLSFLATPWTAAKYSSSHLHPPSPSNAFQYSSRLVAVSLTCLRAIEIRKVPKFQRWRHQSENKRKG